MKRLARERLLKLVADAHDQRRLCVARTPDEGRALSRGVECGLLVRPYPGVYAIAQRWQQMTTEEKCLYAARAIQQRHPTWVFAGPTAALAHGLWVDRSFLDELYLATNRRSHTRVNRGLHRIVVSGDTPVERDGIRVTSFSRTVCDCLRLMSFPYALAVADSALRLKGISRDRLQDNIEKVCCRMPGSGRVRSIIARADGRSESSGESIARAQMILLGYVVPDLQRVIRDPINPEKTFRPDFAWDLPDGSLVIGELDGREKYVSEAMTDGQTTDVVLLKERRRESRLTIVRGRVRVLRFSFDEVMDAKGFDLLLSAYEIPMERAVPEVAS